MDMFAMIGTYESDPFVSVHLTEKYALIAAIRDVMDFLGVADCDDEEDFKGRFAFDEEVLEGLIRDTEVLDGMQAPQLRPVFRAWANLEGVWDNCQGYSITVVKTRVQA